MTSLAFQFTLPAMFIRKSPIKSKKTGGSYFSFRLVESVRIDGKVRQQTLLNLGKHFNVDPAHWNLLANRIDQIMQGSATHGQQNLFDVTDTLDRDLEAIAQRHAALLLQKLSIPVPAGTTTDEQSVTDFQRVDINQLKVLKPRTTGAETLALHAIAQLQLGEKLRHLGFNEKELSAALGTITGRMVHPGSDRETHRWLQQNSALGELIGYDFDTLSLDRVYKTADKLFKHKSAIECHLAQREQQLFNLHRTIILYDLTNTYFEGQATKNSKAKYGRSKEKRKDCPLVTLGLVLDGDGFPLGSQIFEGNASEPKTLQSMLDGLGSASKQRGSTVVIDAGIASQENLEWLRENGYHYIAVSREKYKQKPDLEQGAVIVKPVPNDQVIAQKVEHTDTGEIRLYCHSQKREAKDKAIRNQFNLRYETALTALNEGLSKKRTIKKYEKILGRLGRLKERHARVAGDYDIVVSADEKKINATKIQWTRKKSTADKDENAGVYCLRTDVSTLSEKDLWETYVMLTDIEASFKSMKSELGMRPVYHQNEDRVSAHLFITLLAYHAVHTLRTQLKNSNINLSWQSIRNIMASQQRVTVSMPTADRQQIHIRKTTECEPNQQPIFTALKIKPDVLGPRKTTIEKD